MVSERGVESNEDVDGGTVLCTFITVKASVFELVVVVAGERATILVGVVENTSDVPKDSEDSVDEENGSTVDDAEPSDGEDVPSSMAFPL